MWKILSLILTVLCTSGMICIETRIETFMKLSMKLINMCLFNTQRLNHKVHTSKVFVLLVSTKVIYVILNLMVVFLMKTNTNFF